VGRDSFCFSETFLSEMFHACLRVAASAKAGKKRQEMRKGRKQVCYNLCGLCEIEFAAFA
jgi:hypothetical protein